MKGWIKLHRKILFDDFFMNLTSKQKSVIITILLLATSEESIVKIKGEEIYLSEGECITSLSNLQKFAGIDCSIGSIRNTLKKAEESGFLKLTKNKNFTIIKICNWDKYQSQQDVNKYVETVDKAKKDNRFDNSSEEYRLSKLLYECMLVNNPNCKKPNFESWCNDMNKIIRIDKRSVEDIERVIRWSQKDDFWHKNILSVAKLRKQFDKLILQIPKDSYKADEPKMVNEGGVPDGWSYS